MAEKTGRFAIFEQFFADGITSMFGNPGTVEQGFWTPSTSIRISSTFSRCKKRSPWHRRRLRPRHPAARQCQLHSGVGLGNGIGMIYQAFRGHAPLVVIAGESGIRYDAMDSQMAADLVAMAKPVTKWATRVIDPASTLRVLRRAIKIAMTPPMGPVFVCLPADILDQPDVEPMVPDVDPQHAHTALR